MAIGANFNAHGIEINDGVDRIERPVLPGDSVLHNLIGDIGNEGRRDLNPENFLKMPLNFAGRKVLSIERQDFVVKAVKTRLSLLDDLGLKRTVTVAWDLNLGRAKIAGNLL